MAKEHYRGSRITHEGARALLAANESVSIPGLGIITRLDQLPPPEEFEKGFITGRARALEGHMRAIERHRTEALALQMRDEAREEVGDLLDHRRDGRMAARPGSLPEMRIDDPQGVGRVASPADMRAVVATSRVPPGTVDDAPAGHAVSPLGVNVEAPKAVPPVGDSQGNVAPVPDGILIGGKKYRLVPDEPEAEEGAEPKVDANAASVKGEGEGVFVPNPTRADSFAPGASGTPGRTGVVMGGTPGSGGGGEGAPGGGGQQAPARKVYTPDTSLEEVDDLPAVHILRKHYKTLGEVDRAAMNGEGEENELVKLDGIKDVRLAQIREFFTQLKAGTLASQQEQPPPQE